jgi:hypothetical protein
MCTPPPHGIIGDKVDSGVIGRAELNGTIPIVMGNQEQGQSGEFVCWFQDCGVNLVV